MNKEKVTIRKDHFDYLKEHITELELDNERLRNQLNALRDTSDERLKTINDIQKLILKY